MAFNPDEAGYIHRDGAAKIEGLAFVINSNGLVINAACQGVWPIPATDFARQRMDTIYGSRISVRASPFG